MGLIMIRCPESGREIPTGIEMDMAEFQRAPVFFPRCSVRSAIANTNVREGRVGIDSPERDRIRLGHVHRSVVRRCSPKN